LRTQDLSGLNQLIVVALNDNLLTSVNLTGCTSLTKASLQNNLLTLVEIESIITQVTANGLTNTNTTYPNRLEFGGNPGAVGLNEDNYTLHTTMGWLITF